MKKLFSISLIAILFFTNCSFKERIEVINIQPLGHVSAEYIALVKKSVKSFYGYECVVKPEKKITQDIISKIKKRVDANKLLAKYNSGENTLIITEKDICYYNKEKKNPEYGIFGLGLRPGKICVISTFRLKKNVTKQKTLDRLEKIALHEIGHNLGLEHCTNNKKCMMNAANGTIKQVDLEKVWFCEKCTDLIQ